MAHVVPRDRGLKLRMQSDPPRFLQGLGGAGEGSRHAAEAVVGWGVRAIQADSHARHTAIAELPDNFGGEQRSGAGTDVRSQSQGHAAPEEGEEVRALKRVAAGEYHQWIPEVLDGLQQPASFLRCELRRVPPGDCRGAAVNAGEVTRPRGFPDYQQRRLIEIHTAGAAANRWPRDASFFSGLCAPELR